MSMHAAEETVGGRGNCEADLPPADSDKENRQWTLKGLSSDTVEVTREAAKRSGMKLNAFVSMALEKAALEASSGSVARRISGDENHASLNLQEMRTELSKIRAQGERLEATINSITAILLKLYTERL